MASPIDSVFKKLEPFIIRSDNAENCNTPSSHSESSSVRNTSARVPLPLMSAKLENIQPNARRVPSVTKNIKIEQGAEDHEKSRDIHEELLAKLSQQTSILKGQAEALARVNDSVTNKKLTSAGNSFKEANRAQPVQLPTSIEVERLKRELDAAKEQIAKKNEELHKVRQIRPTQGLDDYGTRQDMTDDAKSDISEPMSSLSRGVNAWDSVSQVGVNPVLQQNIWGAGTSRPWNGRPMPTALPPLVLPQHAARNHHGATSPMSPESPQFFGTLGQFQLDNANRPRANSGGRGRTNPWGSTWTTADVTGMMGMNAAQFQSMHAQNFPNRPVASSTLSAMAPEFTLNNGHPSYSVPVSPGTSYVQTVEPLNYRKLLDRSVSCNWKYIVDKIVCSNDQQASIFLQQKLKVGTAEQKFEIVEAIVAQAYSLMVNRFGNFLVQRCFEHGTPEQVIAIANAIRGNTLSLSMDAFGCHVIQKAFDAVPEEYKAIMVHELLRRIPETVIHRYACHVWQKLFELRWSDSPPQIMKYVNEALHGMWHEVALGETGSLVVQNIFENCLEEDKRPCIEAVLKSIDIVAHGQFGNWCIQHICEHGAPADRSRAIDHVLRYATEYSMDQFASKVVEKCLKIGGNDFLERYLERVCEGRSDRPRIPLIDIASDQYGNYLIQYILTQANAQHREIVASHIRKHMVSLRGSKFGSRVGLLCCNPAYATRPGPAVPVSSGRFPGSNNAGSSVAPGANVGTARYGSGQFQ